MFGKAATVNVKQKRANLGKKKTPIIHSCLKVPLQCMCSFYFPIKWTSVMVQALMESKASRAWMVIPQVVFYWRLDFTQYSREQFSPSVLLELWHRGSCKGCRKVWCHASAVGCTQQVCVHRMCSCIMANLLRYSHFPSKFRVAVIFCRISYRLIKCLSVQKREAVPYD